MLSFFTPRVLTGVINLRPVNHGLFTGFFKHNAPAYVDIFEIVSSLMGASVLPSITVHAPGTMRDSEQLSVSSVKAPRFRPKRYFSAANMLKTQKGLTPYDTNVDPVDAAVAADMDAHVEDIQYMLEVMCAQALVDGKIELYDKVEGSSKKTFTVDFGRPSAHTVTLSGSDLWSASGSDVLGDAEEYSALIENATSGYAATDLILGKSVWPVFMRHADVKDLLDTKNVTIGEMSPRAGHLFKGVWNGLNIWVSNGTYKDISGTATPYLDPKSVLFLSRDVRNEIEYGLPADVECAGPCRYFSKQFTQDDPSGIFTIAESRPLPITKHCGGTVRVKVLS